MNLEYQRVHYYDIAKGFALVLMLIGHTELPKSLEIVNRIIFVFHMPLFFMITGMLTLPELRFDANNKIRKILYPYLWVFVLSILPYYLKFGNLDIVPIFIFMKTRNLFGWENGGGIGPVWFLPVYFFANYIISKAHKVMPLKVLLLISFVVYSILWIIVKHIGLPFLMYQTSLAVVFILLGYFVKRGKWIQNPLILLLGLASAAYCIRCGDFSMYSCICKFWVIQIFAAAFCTIVVLTCSKAIKEVPFLEWVSRHSLLILCIHSIDWSLGISFKILTFFNLPSYSLFFLYCIFIILVFPLIQIIKKLLPDYNSSNIYS